MINYLKNLSKKKTEPETTPVEQPKNKYYLAKYRANVSLHITYNQLDTDGYHEYRQYENIESDDNLVFLEQKNKKIKEYQETISNINEQLQLDYQALMLKATTLQAENEDLKERLAKIAEKIQLDI
jgi:predicted DNA-binding WGR domain protein